MWSTYAGIAQTYFKDSNYVIDKYHYIRQVFWAFEAVRKEEQKKFSKTRRIYFKRSRILLNKRYQFLTPEQRQQVNIMLYTSNRLLTAYSLKEQYKENTITETAKGYLKSFRRGKEKFSVFIVLLCFYGLFIKSILKFSGMLD
jgi:transposase